MNQHINTTIYITGKIYLTVDELTEASIFKHSFINCINFLTGPNYAANKKPYKLIQILTSLCKLFSHEVTAGERAAGKCLYFMQVSQSILYVIIIYVVIIIIVWYGVERVWVVQECQLQINEARYPTYLHKHMVMYSINYNCQRSVAVEIRGPEWHGQWPPSPSLASSIIHMINDAKQFNQFIPYT